MKTRKAAIVTLASILYLIQAAIGSALLCQSFDPPAWPLGWTMFSTGIVCILGATACGIRILDQVAPREQPVH